MKITNYALIGCIFLSSCAHNFKYSEKFINTPSAAVNVSVGKNAYVNSEGCQDGATCDLKNTDQNLLETLFTITSDEKSDLEITQVKTDLNTSGVKCLNGYPVWLALSVVTLGIIPVFTSSAIKARITVRNKKTNTSRDILIDADHTSGMGWLYWFRVWSGKDNWHWTSEIPRRYESQNVYFLEYGNWLLKSDNPSLREESLSL